MEPEEYVRESNKAYQSAIRSLGNKSAIGFKLDKQARTGGITERDSYDDYFILDNLEAERDSIKKALEEL